MNILPKDIENLIYKYKLEIEIYETRKKFKKSLNILKQYNHFVYTTSFGLEAGIMIGNISNRFCLKCHRFIIINYYWKRGLQKKYSENHYCKC